MKNVLSGGSMGYIEAILGYPHPDSSRSSELAPSNYLIWYRSESNAPGTSKY
jgi:hypothetical protein